jgi:hypothetical protein
VAPAWPAAMRQKMHSGIFLTLGSLKNNPIMPWAPLPVK